MSYQEAKTDGIPMKKDSRGFNCYLPPCALCGVPVQSWNYNPQTHYLCHRCREIQKVDKKLTSHTSVHENAW